MLLKLKKVREIFKKIAEIKEPLVEVGLDPRIKEVVISTHELANCGADIESRLKDLEVASERVISPLLNSIIVCFEYAYAQKREDRTIRKFARLIYKELLVKGSEISQKCTCTFLSNLVLMGPRYRIRDKTVDLISGTLASCAQNEIFSEETRNQAGTALSVIEQFSDRPDILFNQANTPIEVEVNE